MELKLAIAMTQKQLEIDKQISGIELEGEKVEALETILSRKPEQILNHFIVASEGKIRSRPLIR